MVHKASGSRQTARPIVLHLLRQIVNIEVMLTDKDIAAAERLDGFLVRLVRDKDLYTTTNKYLQYLIKIRYALF